jgi:hypothetical protein
MDPRQTTLPRPAASACRQAYRALITGRRTSRRHLGSQAYHLAGRHSAPWPVPLPGSADH